VQLAIKKEDEAVFSKYQRDLNDTQSAKNPDYETFKVPEDVEQ
jgi:hypothetical protein